MYAKLLQIYRQRAITAKGQGLVGGLMQWTYFNDDLFGWSQPLRIIEAEWELDIAMFSVSINGLKSFNTLHYESYFIEHIAMVQSNEDARIHASDMSETRVKWFNQKQVKYRCLLTLWILSLRSHNKVTASRLSVLYIDDCPLGRVYFVQGRVLVFGSPWLKFLS